jgi:hypothetical protein
LPERGEFHLPQSFLLASNCITGFMLDEQYESSHRTCLRGNEPRWLPSQAAAGQRDLWDANEIQSTGAMPANREKDRTHL